MYHIVYLCDNNYVMPTVVSITSLVNTKQANTQYVIHVLCDNVSEENLKKIQILGNDMAKIDIILVDSQRFQGVEKDYSSVSKSALLKFSIPDYLSKEVDRALYMDGDTVVLQDLSPIYEVNVREVYAVVVKDGPKTVITGGKQHAYYGDPNYFNSGVMLLNLNKMREDNITEKLIDFRLNEYNYFMDQDAFNQVFGTQVKYMSVENDFMLHLISYINENYSLEQLKVFYDLQDYKNIDALFDNVRILHYTFHKPWKYYDVPFNEIWMKYFKMSPVKDHVLSRKSLVIDMYQTKTYSFSRKLSKIVRSFLFFKYR